MAKAHRGKGIWDQFARGRGECPICKRTGVKVLHEQEVDGVKTKTCKICKATLKNGTRQRV